jgi:hypothetical protein
MSEAVILEDLIFLVGWSIASQMAKSLNRLHDWLDTIDERLGLGLQNPCDYECQQQYSSNEYKTFMH